MTNVFICDLTHTAQTISSEFMPYGQACIASYLKAHSHYPVDVKVFKFLEELENETNKGSLDIIGFSHYLWNADFSLKVAAIIKEKFPQIVIIFGGPNFPVELHRQEEWLKSNRQVDFYIRLEGERPFLNLVNAIIENKGDLERIRKCGIKSTCSYDGKDFYIYPVEERVMDLEDIPSPYLNGYLDKYFTTSLWPLTETNRGCPFQCAYCTAGYKYFNKIGFRDIESIKEELYYIAKNYKNNSMIFMADSNLLMFKRDLEVCKILNETRKKYQWPTFVGCSTGKNKKDIVLEGANLLGGKITVAASVQSMDEKVLQNINRTNVNEALLISMAKEVQRTGCISYSELIACLPGDTLTSHFESMKKLVEAGMSIIKHHVLLLIEGAPLASKEERKKFGFKTRWRVVTKSFGDYEFLGKKFSSIEFEEIVTETDSLTFDDYLFCRKLGLIIHYFYNDSLFEEVHKILRYFNVPLWDWLYSIYDQIGSVDNSLKGLQDDYLEEIKEELWATKEDVTNRLEEYMPEFVSGKRGNNITFKYRALLLKESRHVQDAFEIGFSKMVEILKEQNIPIDNYRDFFDQLKKICLLRKQDIFDTGKDLTQIFDFDFSKMEEVVVMEDAFLKIDGGVTMKIAHSKQQKDFINEYFEVHSKKRVVDVASLLNRVPAKTMYRGLSIKNRKRGQKVNVVPRDGVVL